MAKTTHQPLGKKGSLKSQSIQGKTPRETTTDRLNLLSVARGILNVFSVNSKMKSFITN